jgi:ribonuclease R
MTPNKNRNITDLEKVLAVLRDHKGRALHVMEVSARMNVSSEKRDQVRALLETLEEEGRVQQLPGLRFRALKAREQRPTTAAAAPEPAGTARKPAPTAKLGTLRIHARGHGFVSCEDAAGDVFVAPADLNGALHGDRVAVSVRRGERGLEGSVVAVLGRSLKYVVGPILHLPQGLVIQSQDARLPDQVNLVGDVPGDAVPGLAVVAEIVRFREDGGPPDARVVRVLGVDGSAEVEVAKIKLREGIREEFPEEVLQEARAFGDRVSNKDKRDREDLRDLDLVTIDPATARDHDDAIFIERSERGGYRVVVAIADVSHYVQESTALDAEAIARSTSIYLPDRAIPMLPPELSVNLASLVAGKDRLTLAVDIELGASGQLLSFRYIEGLMRCKAGLTYEGVAAALGLTQQEGPKDRSALRYVPMLEILHECAMLLRGRRMKRGSLDFDLPEPYVDINPESGEPRKVERSRKDPGVRRAYQLVEEMMLLANETVAADLASRRVPAIYRVHGLPDADRLEQFASLAQALGYRLAPEEATSPKQLSRFLSGLDDSPHKSALSYLLLRSMQQASYDTVNVGHFGLAAEHYLHFTSPIRRYPDLAVHRIVRRLARKEPIDAIGLERKLRDQASNGSKLERRAMQVEREVIDVYRCILVKERIGEEFEATVSGVAPHGIYCAFDDPFVEALCHVSALGNDFYEIDKHGLRLVGRRSGASYGLGDRLTVRLESVNVSERAVLAAPVVYVHPDELPARGFDPVHEGGNSRLKRKDKEKDKERAQAAESWGKHHARKKDGKASAVPPARDDRKQDRKLERRRARRSTDDRKERPQRGRR